jgi:putative hydrolases of HD superfamily
VRVGSQRKLLEGTQVMSVLSAATIHQQLAFLAELDQLKSIVRQSPLINRSRKENSAEH